MKRLAYFGIWALASSGKQVTVLCHMDATPSTSTVQLYRPQAVAEVAGISPRTVYLWLHAKLVRASHEVGGEPLFSEAAARDVAALAEHRRMVRASLKVTA